MQEFMAFAGLFGVLAFIGSMAVAFGADSREEFDHPGGWHFPNWPR